MRSKDENVIKDKYQEFVTLFFDKTNENGSKKNITISKSADFDSKFSLSDYTQSKKGSKNFDKIIKELCLDHKKNTDLLLLLRCKVSHVIKDLIYKMHKRYSEPLNLNWDKKDMLSFVLEDDGKRNILTTVRKSNVTRKIKTSFNYEFIENEVDKINQLKKEDIMRILKLQIKETKRIKELKERNSKDNLIKKNQNKKYFRLFPFSSEVIYTFNPLMDAEISTWTLHKLYDDRFLKQYIHRNGRLLLLTRTTLLGTNKLETILKAFEYWGKQNWGKQERFDIESYRKSKEYKYLKITLDYYLENWKTAKSKYNSKNKGKWDPFSDNEFLDKDQIKILQAAADALRTFLGFRKFADNKIKKNDEKGTSEENLLDIIPASTKEEISGLDDFIINFIKNKIKSNLINRLKEDKKSWSKYPERKKAWVLLSKLNIEDTYMRDTIEGELKIISSKCIGRDGQPKQTSWLTKRFLFDKNLLETFDSLKELLIKLTKEKEFISLYNKENKDNKLHPSQIEEIRKRIILDEYINKEGNKSYKYIFDDQLKLKQSIINFQSNFNPKKGRKREFIILIRQILKDKRIIK